MAGRNARGDRRRLEIGPQRELPVLLAVQARAGEVAEAGEGPERTLPDPGPVEVDEPEARAGLSFRDEDVAVGEVPEEDPRVPQPPGEPREGRLDLVERRPDGRGLPARSSLRRRNARIWTDLSTLRTTRTLSRGVTSSPSGSGVSIPLARRCRAILSARSAPRTRRAS